MNKGIKLVEINWEDHWGSSSDWTVEEMLSPVNRVYVTSVGYVKAQDKKHIYIGTQLGTNGTNGHRGIHCILKSCIQKIRVIGWRECK